MAQDQSIFINAEVLTFIRENPYLNAAMFTFNPSSAGFLAGFQAGAEFVDPLTGDGLAAELTVNNWESQLTAWGADSSEPVWQMCSAYFFALAVPDSQGFRSALTKPPHVIIGMRTRSTASVENIEFTTNTAGTVTFTINPSNNTFTDGYLAQFAIVANGVLTVTQLRDNTVAGLNAIAEFAAQYVAAPVGVAGEFTITSLANGFPLIVDIQVTTGGPIMTQAVTTSIVPGDYALDLDDLRRVAEDQDDPVSGKPERRYFWITDSQLNDDINAEGFEWVQDEREATFPRAYQFHGQSHDPLNFDPLSAGTSAAEVAAAANGGAGWNYASVVDHDKYEWLVAALFGRTIGYLPGAISFTDKQLYGSTRYAKMTPRDKADNASLADTRHFNYYSPEGPRGSFRWGFLADGSYWDRDWVAVFAKYYGEVELTSWKQQNNIVNYTDDSISAGAGVIKRALLRLPGIAALPDLLVVNFVGRQQVDPLDIANREYNSYEVFAGYAGPINRFGTVANPINFSISETIS